MKRLRLISAVVSVGLGLVSVLAGLYLLAGLPWVLIVAGVALAAIGLMQEV